MAESKEELKSLVMRVKDKSEQASLKLNVKKKKLRSWQIEGGKVEAGTDFLFLHSGVTADGDCSYEIKRRLLLGRKAMKNLDSLIKKQRYHFANKGPYSQSYGFCSRHAWM